MSSPLQNIYYARKVATPRPCYICKRPTETVLATIKTEDFLYTCESHLTDTGFASPISPAPTPNPGPSADDIKKVISDYHAREAKKGDKDKEKNADEKDKNKENEKDKEKGKDTPTDIPSVPAASTPAASHRKYELHRQIFDMRRAELKRKEQGVKAKEVGKGMPQVPRGMF